MIFQSFLSDRFLQRNFFSNLSSQCWSLRMICTSLITMFLLYFSNFLPYSLLYSTLHPRTNAFRSQMNWSNFITGTARHISSSRVISSLFCNGIQSSSLILSFWMEPFYRKMNRLTLLVYFSAPPLLKTLVFSSTWEVEPTAPTTLQVLDSV